MEWTPLGDISGNTDCYTVSLHSHNGLLLGMYNELSVAFEFPLVSWTHIALHLTQNPFAGEASPSLFTVNNHKSGKYSQFEAMSHTPQTALLPAG